MRLTTACSGRRYAPPLMLGVRQPQTKEDEMNIAYAQGRLRLFLGIASLACGLVIVGCATIMHGTTQGIGFASTPTGAAITVDNQTHGTTPTVVNLSRKDTHIVKIELAGYQPFETTITRSVSGWVWGNIVFGGLIGLAVDAISGGLYKLSPEQVQATLSKEGIGLLYKEDAMYFAVTLQPDPSWERVATLSPVTAR
jgi:uncharacterized protein YceK